MTSFVNAPYDVLLACTVFQALNTLQNLIYSFSFSVSGRPNTMMLQLISFSAASSFSTDFRVSFGITRGPDCSNILYGCGMTAIFAGIQIRNMSCDMTSLSNNQYSLIFSMCCHSKLQSAKKLCSDHIVHVINNFTTFSAEISRTSYTLLSLKRS